MNTDQAMTAFIDSYFHAVKGFTAALQAAVSPYKISFEQYQIMRDIATGRIETLTDIVKLRGVTKPAIARQIGSLLRLGYVQQKKPRRLITGGGSSPSPTRALTWNKPSRPVRAGGFKPSRATWVPHPSPS